MMCTLSPCLIACVTFTVSWKRVCGPSQASGCTKERPSIGESPLGHERLQRAAVLADLAAVVWRGSEDLQSHRRGIKVFWTPLGHQDFVRARLEMLSAHHHTLLARIPMVEDVQSAWLLRANHVARVVEPHGSRVLSET